MISAKVDKADDEQIADIRKYFDEKFNKIVNRRIAAGSLCGMKEVDSPPKIKEYEVALVD
jgi:hypothetical protein